MLRLFCIYLLCIYNAESTCSISVPSELINGCAFSSVEVYQSNSEFLLGPTNCGSLIPASSLAEQPYIIWNDVTDLETLYTVLILDADDPYNSEGEYYINWMRVNIIGSDLAAATDNTSGEDIFCYVSPMPNECSVHQYVVLVYEQRTPPAFIPVPYNRTRFNLDEWQIMMQPPGALCGPVASTAFQMQS